MEMLLQSSSLGGCHSIELLSNVLRDRTFSLIHLTTTYQKRNVQKKSIV